MHYRQEAGGDSRAYDNPCRPALRELPRPFCRIPGEYRAREPLQDREGKEGNFPAALRRENRYRGRDARAFEREEPVQGYRAPHH